MGYHIFFKQFYNTRNEVHIAVSLRIRSFLVISNKEYLKFAFPRGVFYLYMVFKMLF